MFTLTTNDDLLSAVDCADVDASVIRFENVDGAETMEWRCTACGAGLWPETAGYADESGERTCLDYDPDEDPDHDGLSGPDFGEGPHRAERVALSWANGAAIHTDPEGDAITVTLSVGDPRGALAFTVRRIPDDASNHAGRLLLHTPYPGEPWPHVELTEDHPGTYWLG